MFSQSVGELLMSVVEMDASDLHLIVGCPPIVRRFGELVPLEMPKVSADDARSLLAPMFTAEQSELLERNRQIDFACDFLGVARFRVHVSYERDRLNAEFRVIPFQPPRLEDLLLPPVVAEVAAKPHGLVLVTGPTGAGKSTTLAGIVEYLNRSRSLRIVTIEEPIEFVHESAKAYITQREIGKDCKTYADAIRATLRQDPDVILIGEMRDLESIALSLGAAETGHLVLATLHTLSASDSVNRIVDVFPFEQQDQVRVQLASVIEAVFSQALVMRADGSGRVCAMEVLLGTPAVRAMIRENKTAQLADLLQTGTPEGIQSLDRHLAQLVQSGTVAMETAMLKATHADELQRMLGAVPLGDRRSAITR